MRHSRRWQENINSSGHEHQFKSHRNHDYPHFHGRKPHVEPRQECVEWMRQMLPKTGKITVELKGRKGGQPKRSGTTSVQFHIKRPHRHLDSEESPGKDESDEKYAKELCRLLMLDDADNMEEIDLSTDEDEDRRGQRRLGSKQNGTSGGSASKAHCGKKDAMQNRMLNGKRKALLATKSSQSLVNDEDYEQEVEDCLTSEKKFGRKLSEDKIVSQLEKLFQQMNFGAPDRHNRDPFYVERKAPTCRTSPETLKLIQSIGDPDRLDRISRRDLKHLLRKELTEERSTSFSRDRSSDSSKRPGIGRATQTDVTTSSEVTPPAPCSSVVYYPVAQAPHYTTERCSPQPRQIVSRQQPPSSLIAPPCAPCLPCPPCPPCLPCPTAFDTEVFSVPNILPAPQPMIMFAPPMLPNCPIPATQYQFFM